MNALHFSFQQLLTHHEVPKMNETMPIASSSHASSLRFDDETQEHLRRFLQNEPEPQRRELKRFKYISFLFQKGHCEHLRNGFLQVVMAGMRQSNRMILLKKKRR